MRISPLVPIAIFAVAGLLILILIFRGCSCGKSKPTAPTTTQPKNPPSPPPSPPSLPPPPKPYENLPILEIKQFKNYPTQEILISCGKGYRIILFNNNWTVNWIKFTDNKSWGHILPFSTGCEAQYISKKKYYIPHDPVLIIIERERTFKLKGSPGDMIAVWADNGPSPP